MINVVRYDTHMKKIKMKKKSKKLIEKIIGVTLAVGFVIAVYVFGILSPVSESLYYRIEQGETISSVATDMKQKNIIESADLFKIAVLISGGRVQTGTYEIPAGATIWRIAKMMVTGDIASVSITIPEGLTVKQIYTLLEDSSALVGSARDIDYKDGELFPDTYRVPRGISRASVLDLMKKKMDSVRVGWENSGRAMPPPLKNWNEVVTLASIVQKETPRASEMPTVASVYLNRLRARMKLQADPTVVYAVTGQLGDMQGNPLLTGHLQTPHPFNTYANYGLPPAPIANVGADAIRAVLNPADTTYLFFVADGTGGHRFAVTYAEHQKNHADWREIRRSKSPLPPSGGKGDL